MANGVGGAREEKQRDGTRNADGTEVGMGGGRLGGADRVGSERREEGGEEAGDVCRGRGGVCPLGAAED